jgi:hypothetical protein
MKWVLVLVICSLESNSCMPPFKYPILFDDGYDCMVQGYKESLSKIEEMGREDINKHQIYIKFGCTPQSTV